MKILISGASGFIGKALSSHLKAKGHNIFYLVRNAQDKKEKSILWDPMLQHASLEEFEGFDAYIHLSGENIFGYWTKRKMKEIEYSRVSSTNFLCDIIHQLKHKPKLLICASATGFYGDCGNKKLSESDQRGKGFLANTCEAWEKAASKSLQDGVRVISLRTSMVISEKGGALKSMIPLFKSYLGIQWGDGSQYVSWIDLRDYLQIIDFCLENRTLCGPVNAASPEPLTHLEFTETLARALGSKIFLSIPKFLVKCILGSFGEEIFLYSTRVYPKKLQDAGFIFKYPHFSKALTSRSLR